MKTVLRAFHNDAKIKEKFVLRVKAHIEADQLVHGTGWDKKNCKGCAVGCTLNKYDHNCYENELGLPSWLAHLEDYLFENMSIEKSRTWPKDFLEAIPIGADLSKVFNKINIWNLEGLKTIVDSEFKDVIKCIDGMIELHLREASGVEVTEKEWAASAASAAWAAEAAWAAGTAWAAEGTKFCDRMADKLLELLKEA